MRTAIPAIVCAATLLLAACGQSAEPPTQPAATAETDAATQSDATAETDTTPVPTNDAEAEPIEEAAPSEPDSAPAVPLLELADGMTWNELLREVASDHERECVARTIDNEDLPRDFLDGAAVDHTTGSGGWPYWYRRIVGIDVGDNHWPHQVWRCLDADTASALYVSVRLEEIRLLDGISVSQSDAACVTQLPTDTELQRAVSDRLGSEYSFDDDDDLLTLLVELDETVDPKLLPCLSDAVALVIDASLTDVLGDAVSQSEQACLVDAIMDYDSLDVSPLFLEGASDDYLDTELLPALEAALEACEFLAGTSSDPSAEHTAPVGSTIGAESDLETLIETCDDSDTSTEFQNGVRDRLRFPGSMEVHGAYIHPDDVLDNGDATITLDFSATAPSGITLVLEAWAAIDEDCKILSIIDDRVFYDESDNPYLPR